MSAVLDGPNVCRWRSIKKVRATSLKKKPAKTREQKRHSLFMKRTLSVCGGMRQRHKRLGYSGVMPITTEIIRGIVAEALEDDNLCIYCESAITLKNFSLDHKTPVERGGKWGGSNLDVICKSCNTAKGRMTDDEFESVMAVLRTFPPEVMRETLGRLKAGASVIRLQFLGRSKKA